MPQPIVDEHKNRVTASPSFPEPRWRPLFSNAGFTYYFAGLFISLLGTGMNFAGVTLYVLAKTHSTVQVSFTVILLTLPRLVIPPFGGVLTDRVDRRYLNITLDIARAGIVLGTAALAWQGHLELWQLYLMVLLLGVGFAIYWSSNLALLQELIPAAQLVNANSAVLIAVQGGMLAAGATVGFIYESAGLPGILGIDGCTYVLSAVCFYLLRRGYFAPHRRPRSVPWQTPAIESPSEQAGTGVMIVDGTEPEPLPSVLADIHEGLSYLRSQPAVLALGMIYACMMAGVISANVVVVALANDLLHAGPRGYGFIEGGWALGAVIGGLAAGPLVRRRPYSVLMMALFLLAVGHVVFPYARFLFAAVAMNAVFGLCRAVVAVLTQSAILAVVPRHLMGRTQSAFAVIATTLQVVMSLLLGWVAESVNLSVAFLLLGLLYGVAVIAAVRARDLCAFPARELRAT